MTQTITGLYDSYADAKAAVEALEAAGVPHGDVSIIASDAAGEHGAAHGLDPVADDAGKGAGVGAALGGAGGLLAGIGFLAIPGLGPVVAAGWLAATAVGAVGGAVIGGAAGGIVGALTKEGVPEADAHVYAEGVRRGGSLVSARVNDDLADTARSILSDERAVDVQARSERYRGEGWSRFDESAPVYTPEEALAERGRYGGV